MSGFAWILMLNIEDCLGAGSSLFLIELEMFLCLMCSF